MLHKHRCPECAYVWEHEGPRSWADVVQTAGKHTCPNCGLHDDSNYVKYHGDTPAGEFDRIRVETISVRSN